MRWNRKDHDLYMNLVYVLVKKIDTTNAWEWARYIVNLNKYNKENRDETK